MAWLLHFPQSLSVYRTEQGIDTKKFEMQFENCSNNDMLAGIVVGESRHVAKPLIKYLMHFPWCATAHIYVQVDNPALSM